MHTRARTDDRYCAKCGGELEPRVLKPEDRERLACRECGTIRYLDPRVAAGTITVHDGGIVLLRRALAPQIGRWVFPGGYVDRGEPVDVAAVRETREEVGLKVSLIGILDVYSYEGEDVVLIAYSADVIGGELKAGDEAQEVAVFPPEELPWDVLGFRATRAALRDYVRRFYPRVRVPRSE